MFDLKDLDTKANGEKGSVLKLRHPATGEILFSDEKKVRPFTLTLVGMDSDRFQKARKKLAESSRDDGNHELGVKSLVAGTLGCHLILDGKQVELSDIGGIYDQYPWIAEQAIQFMADRANFIKA